jgi:hypothetical protein
VTVYQQFTLVIASVQAFALMPTLIFGGFQMLLQRRELSRQRATLGYEIYQRVSNANTELLWKAAEDPCLNDVFEPIDPRRRAELDAAQVSSKWGAWYAMTDEEKKGNRFTRMAIELAEQAWEIDQLGMAPHEASQKWSSWSGIWCETRYFRYVFADEEPRLLKGFAERLHAQCD